MLHVDLLAMNFVMLCRKIIGQKINSLGFKLSITQSHDSIWFLQPTIYFENIQEDKRTSDWI